MKELSPPALNLKRLVKETVPGEPILVVISPGADPSQVSLLSFLSKVKPVLHGKFNVLVNHCNVELMSVVLESHWMFYA